MDATWNYAEHTQIPPLSGVCFVHIELNWEVAHS